MMETNGEFFTLSRSNYEDSLLKAACWFCFVRVFVRFDGVDGEKILFVISLLPIFYGNSRLFTIFNQESWYFCATKFPVLVDAVHVVFFS